MTSVVTTRRMSQDLCDGHDIDHVTHDTDRVIRVRMVLVFRIWTQHNIHIFYWSHVTFSSEGYISYVTWRVDKGVTHDMDYVVPDTSVVWCL